MGVMTKGARPNGHDHDPKIASLDEARRRRQEQVRSLKELTGATDRPRRSARELLTGGLIVVMALGMLLSIVGPFFGFNVFPVQ